MLAIKNVKQIEEHFRQDYQYYYMRYLRAARAESLANNEQKEFYGESRANAFREFMAVRDLLQPLVFVEDLKEWENEAEKLFESLHEYDTKDN